MRCIYLQATLCAAMNGGISSQRNERTSILLHVLLATHRVHYSCCLVVATGMEVRVHLLGSLLGAGWHDREQHEGGHSADEEGPHSRPGEFPSCNGSEGWLHLASVRSPC